MRLYENVRPSHGVAYKPWVDRIRELLEEKSLELPPSHELRQHYWDDLSYEEVLFKEQFKTMKSIWMELHVRHQGGEFSESFKTANQAKDFFKRFPELRQELDRM